jgi:hypothetical protein
MNAGILDRPKAEVIELAVEEAIRRLGYLNQKAQPFLSRALQEEHGVHPRALSTAHRKEGEQITRDELKALGLRANAFMSRAALAEITEVGLRNPLTAHEKTLLRAYFSVARWRSLNAAATGLEAANINQAAVSYRYDMLPPVCDQCRSLNGDVTTPETAQILPPEDCLCETANYGIQMKIDFFHDLV